MVDPAKEYNELFRDPEERISSDSFEHPCRELLDLQEMPREELIDVYDSIYREKYIKADLLRENGKHDRAFIFYKHAQSILEFVESQGIKNEPLLIKEIHCSYQIIQCLINLQQKQDVVMRELHNISSVLYEMIKKITDDNPHLIEIILEEYKNTNQIKVEQILEILINYYEQNKNNLGEEKLVAIWRCAYYINRYSGISHDFFLSTPLVHVVKNLDKTFAKSTKLTLEVGSNIPQHLIDSDPSGINKTVKALTGWLEIYDCILTADTAVSFGDHDESLVLYHNKLITKLKYKISSYLCGDIKTCSKTDFEHSLEVLAKVYYSLSCIDEENYEDSMQELDDLLEKTINSDLINDNSDELYSNQNNFNCKRVAENILIYKALSSIRYGKIDIATGCYNRAFNLRNSKEEFTQNETTDQAEPAEEAKSAAPQLVDMWLDVIKAEILLKNFEKSKSPEKISDSIVDAIQNLLKDLDNDQSEPNYKFQLDTLGKIEQSFSSYTHDQEKNGVDSVRLSSQPLLAQIHFILGKTALYKAKIYGEYYKQDKKNKEKGRLLLDTFKAAHSELCSAYSILINMANDDPTEQGYKDQKLLKEIFSVYKEMLNYNYELSGLDKAARGEILPKSVDMDQIVMHWQLQDWTDVVFNLIQNKNLLSKKDFVISLSGVLLKSLKELIPSVTSVNIYEALLSKEDMSPDLKEKYFYNTEKGKIVISKSVDDFRHLFVETRIPFTMYEKKLLEHITDGVQILLRIYDFRSDIDQCPENEISEDQIVQILTETYNLFKYLFVKHKPTITHSEKMAQFIEIIVKQILKENPGSKIDPLMVKFAALLHDIGKLYLNPQLILDKRSKLLPVEMDEVEKHALVGPDLLAGLLGLSFKTIIALSGSHHLQYSGEGGYPFRLPSQTIKTILPELAPRLSHLTTEQKKQLETTFLTNEYQNMAHIFNIIDQIQAFTAKDRAYRSPEPLDKLYGRLRRLAGSEFNPHMVNFVLKIIKNGDLDHLFYHYDDFDEQLRKFEPILIYSRDEIVEFFEKYKETIGTMLNINIGNFILALKIGYKKNLALSPQCLGWAICDHYIKKAASEGFKNPREQGVFEYKQDRDSFFQFFHEHLQELPEIKTM